MFFYFSRNIFHKFETLQQHLDPSLYTVLDIILGEDEFDAHSGTGIGLHLGSIEREGELWVCHSSTASLEVRNFGARLKIN